MYILLQVFLLLLSSDQIMLNEMHSPIVIDENEIYLFYDAFHI